ncbi:MAG: hypothetical protein IAE82_21730 [Opitutaceae bacterium]|nr:hypothetical protein [Opitutaceae bacterium]
MTLGQGVKLGPLSFPIFRILILAGAARVVIRREWIAGKFNSIDKLLFAFSAWIVIASFAHEWQPGSGPIYASGMVFNIAGSYLLTRIWCRTIEETVDLAGTIALMLAPIAVFMALEMQHGRNLFGVFGGVSEIAIMRDGRFRASGPFAHPILAGTVGATCLPLMVAIWRFSKPRSVVGVISCCTMIVASASSGPILSCLCGLGALTLWLQRGIVRVMLVGGVLAYVLAEIVMSQPAVYLLARMDVTGSSTGYHRAHLIDSAFQHMGEWWLFGTDYTRHWMQTGINASHVDVTNYYIAFGVTAGLPAMLLMVAIMWKAFSAVGSIARSRSIPSIERFAVWALGSSLFAHAATSVSVAYFDQSMLFFWTTIAMIASQVSLSRTAPQPAPARRTVAPQSARAHV